MRTASRLAAYFVVLGLVLGGAAVAGGAIDPGRIGGDENTSEDHGSDEMSTTTHDDSATAGHDAADETPAGLAVAEAGYRLELDTTTLAPGERHELSFRIVDESGAAVEDFDVEHGKRLHLIVVRRDLTGYQHLHPELAADGTWSVPVTLPAPGAYRVFADFSTGGEALTLGADLLVPGDFEPRPLPEPSDVARADGYEVRLSSPDEGMTEFRVSRDGRPVEDLQPYLGARGHLVVLREGDLAYLHVHPEEESADGSAVAFHAELPTVGRYRMFFQFRHEDSVHTVAFTREVSR